MLSGKRPGFVTDGSRFRFTHCDAAATRHRRTAAARPRYSSGVPFGVSIWEILILLLVVLLLFGPRRLPEMGRSLGKGMREFKDSIAGKDDEPTHVAQLNAADPAVQPAAAGYCSSCGSPLTAGARFCAQCGTEVAAPASPAAATAAEATPVERDS